MDKNSSSQSNIGINGRGHKRSGPGRTNKQPVCWNGFIMEVQQTQNSEPIYPQMKTLSFQQFVSSL